MATDETNGLPSGGDSCSIDVDLLATYLATGRSEADDAEIERAAVASLEADTVDRSPSGYWSGTGIELMAALLEVWGENHGAADVVRQAAIDADVLGHQPIDGGAGTGMVSVPSSVVGQALFDYGYTTGPGVLEVVAGERIGADPISGFADDPVSTLNGNFVHRERDLVTGGLGGLIDLRRTYNSLAARRRGRFGAGWSSLLDVRAEAGPDGTVVVTRLDGSLASFRPDGDGGFEPNHRRQLRLRRLGDGLVLEEGADCSFELGADGVLTAGSHHLASFTVDRPEGSGPIRVVEHLSGRELRCQIGDHGLVTTVETGDGRQVHFTYRDGHCTRVSGPQGSISYEIENGMVVARLDADGVALFRNQYDDRGRVVSQLSPFGARSRFTYDGATTTVSYGVDDGDQAPANQHVHDDRGRLVELRRSDGAALRIGYDTADRPVTMSDPAGGTTTYGYEGTDIDQWTSRTNPDGTVEERELDSTGRLVRQVDAAGGVHEYRYQGDDRWPSSVIDPLGGETRIGYDHRGLPQEITDPDGYRRLLLRNRDGLVRAALDGSGYRRSSHYSPAGHLIGLEDSLGATATIELDEAGRRLAVSGRRAGVGDGTAPASTAFAYTPAGRRSSCSIDGDLVWRATYGAHGELEELIDAAGGSVQLAYDPYSRVESVTAPDGATAVNQYDAEGRLRATVSPDGHRIERAYHRQGQVEVETSPDGATTTRVTDEAGRPVELTWPDGTTTSYRYHPGGPLASVEGPTGTVTFEVDLAGRLVAAIDRDGGRSGFDWSPAGRLRTAVSPAGRRLSFSYDDAGLLASVTDDDGIEVSGHLVMSERGIPAELDPLTAEADSEPWSEPLVWHPPLAQLPIRWSDEGAELAATAEVRWDQRGTVDTITDRAGVHTDVETDELGRVTGLKTGPTEVSVAYQASGEVVSVASPRGQLTLVERSADGQLLALDRPGLSPVTFDHDRLGRITSITSAGEVLASLTYYQDTARLMTAVNEQGQVTADHDPGGRLRSVVDLDGGTTTYGRDIDGLVTDRTGPDGWTVRYQRSAAGRVVAIGNADTGMIECPSDPTLGADRDDAGRVSLDRAGRRFTYDEADRLVASALPAAALIDYHYDEAGRLAREVTAGVTRRFTYDRAGQLVRVEGDHGLDLTCGYDQCGRRTWEVWSDGRRVDYVWNVLDHLVRVDRTAPDGSITSRHLTYSALGRVEQVDEITIDWDDGESSAGKPVRVGDARYLRSGLLVRAVDGGGSGTWSDGTSDDPWGADDGFGVRLGFRNELAVDEVVFMGARVYHPPTRSFLTPDPLPPALGADSCAGAYVYARNDPVNLVDPSGRSPISVDDFPSVREHLEQSRIENFTDDYVKPAVIAAFVPVMAQVAPILLANGFLVHRGLVFVGDRAEDLGLEDEWNSFYYHQILEPATERLSVWGERLIGPVDEGTRGDPGGTMETQERQPLLVEGSTPEERGRALVNGALDHTGDPLQIKPDELEILDHGNGSYTVVLPGVTDLSNPSPGFNPIDQTVRDTDQVALDSFRSADVADNDYARYVEEALVHAGVPDRADISIVGHSQGADTAVDLAADSELTGRYNVTHVVAAAYDTAPQLPFVDSDVEVLMLQNRLDVPMTVEQIFSAPMAGYGDPAPIPGNVTEAGFVGGFEGYGHHQDNYMDYLGQTDDPEVVAFLEDMAEAGYGESATSTVVDISYDPTVVS
jgi:RHS repeat-associated protein